MARRGRQRTAKGPRLTEAPEELLTLAARIIDEDYSQLAEAKIIYYLVNGNWRKGGETIEADCQLVTGPARKETGNIFRIFINAKTRETADGKYQQYLIANQLYRCCKAETGNGDPRWYVSDYSVKAFPQIVAKYGTITGDLRQLEAAIQQMNLFDATEDKPDQAAQPQRLAS